MSRAKAAADRAPLDFYATPEALAGAICGRLSLLYSPNFIVEPSAGSGSFVKAARLTWPTATIHAIDLDPEHVPDLEAAGADLVFVNDWSAHALDHLDVGRVPPGLIVGNPPYRQAKDHVEKGLRWLSDGGALAFLLRLNFLGSAARVPFWDAGQLHSIATIVPRPSFTNGGTDGTEYALFVWVKGYAGRPQIAPHLVWSPRSHRRGGGEGA